MHEYSPMKCVLVLICIQHVTIHGYRSYPGDDVIENDKYTGINNKHAMDENSNYREYPSDRTTKQKSDLKHVGNIENELSNPIFVKRLLPHGYPATDSEYDAKLKTLYVPLVRYHVRKPLYDVTGGNTEDETYRKGTRDGFIVIIVNSKSKPKKGIEKRNKFSDTIKELAASIVGSYKAARDGRSLVSGRFRRHKRTPVVDPLAVPNRTKSKLSDTHYPFWKYWTMDRPLHVDECPVDQVKVGNVCISTRNK